MIQNHKRIETIVLTKVSVKMISEDQSQTNKSLSIY